MKIGILTCGHLSDDIAATHGDYPSLYASLLDGNGFTFISYNVEKMEFPESIRSCDGWLLTGSKHGAYDGCAFIPPLETFIRDAYAQDVPLVGICFGHQIIAQALGGHVEKFKDGWALGLNAYQFDGLGQLKLNAWHQDQVTLIPKDAKPIASSEFCAHAALIYGKKAWTLQPHPEFDGKFIADFTKTKRGVPGYREEQLDQALKDATKQDDNAVIAKQISNFFKSAVSQ